MVLRMSRRREVYEGDEERGVEEVEVKLWKGVVLEVKRGESLGNGIDV